LRLANDTFIFDYDCNFFGKKNRGFNNIVGIDGVKDEYNSAFL